MSKKNLVFIILLFLFSGCITQNNNEFDLFVNGKQINLNEKEIEDFISEVRKNVFVKCWAPAYGLIGYEGLFSYSFTINNKNYHIWGDEPVVSHFRIDDLDNEYSADPYSKLFDLIRAHLKKYCPEVYDFYYDEYYNDCIYWSPYIMSYMGEKKGFEVIWNVAAAVDITTMSDIVSLLGNGPSSQMTIYDYFIMNYDGEPSVNSELISDGLMIKLVGMTKSGWFFYVKTINTNGYSIRETPYEDTLQRKGDDLG